MNKSIDFFICHASEDKNDFVRQLAQQLIIFGAAVFYDEYSIKLGDSLTQKINEGIASSKHGVIVLSNFFFEKKWTQAEMQAIFNGAVNEGYKLLIIYHGVDNNEVRSRYPLLSDIKAINSKDGVQKVAAELMDAANIRFGGSAMISPTVGRSININEGISIMMSFALPNVWYPVTSQVICELGVPNKYNARIRLSIKWNSRLYFEIISEEFQHIGISTDLRQWEDGNFHFITANLDARSNSMYLMVDGIVKDEFQRIFNLSEFFCKESGFIIGSSLELLEPWAGKITHIIIHKSCTVEMAKLIYDNFLQGRL